MWEAAVAGVSIAVVSLAAGTLAGLLSSWLGRSYERERGARHALELADVAHELADVLRYEYGQALVTHGRDNHREVRRSVEAAILAHPQVLVARVDVEGHDVTVEASVQLSDDEQATVELSSIGGASV